MSDLPPSAQEMKQYISELESKLYDAARIRDLALKDMEDSQQQLAELERNLQGEYQCQKDLRKTYQNLVDKLEAEIAAKDAQLKIAREALELIGSNWSYDYRNTAYLALKQMDGE